MFDDFSHSQTSSCWNVQPGVQINEASLEQGSFRLQLLREQVPVPVMSWSSTTQKWYEMQARSSWQAMIQENHSTSLIVLYTKPIEAALLWTVNVNASTRHNVTTKRSLIDISIRECVVNRFLFQFNLFYLIAACLVSSFFALNATSYT